MHYIQMVKALKLLTLLLGVQLGLLSTPAIALPIDIEIDRYLLAAQKHINEQNYAAAEIYLIRIQGIDSPTKIDMPPEFYYYYGVVLQHDKKFSQATQQYEEYIAKTGKDGNFYQQTLEAMTTTEEAESKQDNSVANQEVQKIKRSDVITQLSQANLSQDSDYDRRIKSLFLSEKIEDALILHINSLLSTYPFSGKNIQTSDLQKAITYKIRINKNKDIVTQRQDNTNTNPLISSNKFSIYGANPFIYHQCNANRARCEIKTPDGENTWVELSYEKQAAKEVAYAFSRLIKALQRSN